MAEGIIRELVTLLGFKVDEKTITEYEARVTGAKQSLRRLAWAAAIAGGAIAGVAVKTIRAGSELVDASARLGMGVQALQEWRYAAEQAGVSADAFSMAIQFFGRSAADSAMGIGRARVAFARLAQYGMGRLTGPDGKLRNLADLLPEAMLSLSKMENPIERNALAMKLFGDQGLQVVQMLDEGITSIEEARAEFRLLGAGMDEDTAKAAKRAGDAWTRFRTSLSSVVYTIGAKLLPAIEGAFNWLSKWLARHRTFAAVLGGAALALGVFVAGIYAAVAAKKVWALATLVLNKQMALLLVKLLAIPALLAAVFALVYMIVEDITLFFMNNGTDTITGRLVSGIGALGTRAWAWIAGKAAALPALFYSQIDLIKAYWLEKWDELVAVVKGITGVISTAIGDAFNAIRGAWSAVVEWMKQLLRDALMWAVPERLQEFMGLNEKSKAPEWSGPPDLMPWNAGAQGGASPTNIAINIASTPGATPTSIAREVVLRLSGEDIGASLQALGAR